MARIDWNDLPVGVRDAIRDRTGPVTGARTVSGGLNSEVAMILDTTAEPVFVKGRPVGRPEQQREAVIGPHVGRVSRRLLWRVETGGWDLLGFEYVKGRHADYAPGSPDVTAVVATLDVLSDVSCPDVPVKDATRWRPYADHGDTTPFAGDTLLHTDWKPDNVLIEPDGTVRVIDWAWPTRGAAWIDPACLLLQLVAHGHSPADADALVAQTRAWRDAPASAVDGFCRATVRLWNEIASNNPTPWHRGMAAAAGAWARSRLSIV